MHGPVSCLQSLQAHAGGIQDLLPGDYVRYLGTVASVSAFCYPAGSRKWLSRRIKLVLLSAIRRSTAQPWLRAASSCALLQRVVAARPLVLEKPFRPLGAYGLRFGERARLVLEHFAVMHDTLPACLADRVYLAGGLDWAFGDGRYTLRLTDSGPNPREGELGFYWIDNENGASLAQLSFYLRRADDGVELYIGGLQGPMNGASLDWIRAATKACQGLRPKDALMQALLALAGQVGARRIVAVSRANHVGRQRHRPREIQADYESFWMEYHGTALPDGNFEVPVQQPERDIAEVASKKRSAWRRKQALAASIRHAVALGLRPEAEAASNDGFALVAIPAA